MHLSLYLLGHDTKHFVRKNSGKLIVFALIFVVCMVIAVRNVFALNTPSDYVENANSALIAYARGNGSFLTLFFVSVLEGAMMVFVVFACSYSDLALIVSYVPFIYKSYSGVFKATAILITFGAKSIPFFVLYILCLLGFLVSYASLIVSTLNSHLRWCYGKNELYCLLLRVMPCIVSLIVVTAINLLFVSIGCTLF
jgi:hypothetical protein